MQQFILDAKLKFHLFHSREGVYTPARTYIWAKFVSKLLNLLEPSTYLKSKVSELHHFQSCQHQQCYCQLLIPYQVSRHLFEKLFFF
jgi:hypothetical protein